MFMSPPPDTDSVRDVLRELLAPLPALVRYVPPEERRQVSLWGTRVSSSTADDAVYRAGWIGKMPIPLDGAVSNDVADHLKAVARS